MKSSRLAVCFITISFLAGCENYPRDMAGTLQNIEQTGVVRVGVVEGQDLVSVSPFLRHLQVSTHSKVRIVRSQSDILIAALETGQIDLVVGQFDNKSPLATEVSFLEPLESAKVGKNMISLRPVARNGENRWIMRLEVIEREMSRK